MISSVILRRQIASRLKSGVRSCSFLKSAKTKFYTSVTVLRNEVDYSVCLDNRSIKTPLGKPFGVVSESIAHAVANEWHCQDKSIAMEGMPLTLLCNMCIDNPLHKSNDELQDGILAFLETDTLCAKASDPEDLVAFQEEHWDPVISWFEKRYNVSIASSSDLLMAPQPVQTIDTLKKELAKFNQWQLFALESAVSSVKSLILSLATMEQFVDVEKAVFLSHLETEFQILKWGRVEWSHDVDTANNTTQLAAASLVFAECKQ